MPLYRGNIPLQTLKIVQRLLPEVLAGIKLHTIRWQETGILPGAMRYVNTMDASDTVLVQVTHVEYMRLSEVYLLPG